MRLFHLISLWVLLGFSVCVGTMDVKTPTCAYLLGSINRVMIDIIEAPPDSGIFYFMYPDGYFKYTAKELGEYSTNCSKNPSENIIWPNKKVNFTTECSYVIYSNDSRLFYLTCSSSLNTMDEAEKISKIDGIYSFGNGKPVIATGDKNIRYFFYYTGKILEYFALPTEGTEVKDKFEITYDLPISYISPLKKVSGDVVEVAVYFLEDATESTYKSTTIDRLKWEVDKWESSPLTSIRNFDLKTFLLHEDSLILAGVFSEGSPLSSGGNASIVIIDVKNISNIPAEIVLVRAGGATNKVPGKSIIGENQSPDSVVRWSVLTEIEDDPTSLIVEPGDNQLFVTFQAINSFSGVIRVNLNNISLKLSQMVHQDQSRALDPIIFKNEDKKVLLVPYSSALAFYYPPNPCPQECSNVGTCVKGVCKCNEGHYGDDCSARECKFECLNGGNCTTSGICSCQPEWTGVSCSTRQCKNHCRSQGSCTGSPNYECICSNKYSGDDCSILASTVCHNFTEDTCVTKVGYCGWCRTEKSCMPGTIDGPTMGTCESWHVDSKWRIVLLLVAILFIIVLGLMIVNNVISAMPMDYATAVVLSQPESLLTAGFLKEAYWRDERSSKAWILFEQFQYVSCYAFLAVSVPTGLIQFTSYFNWTNFNLPRPFGYKYPGKVEHQLSKRSYIQYGNSVGIGNEQIFYATMFWFSVLLCAVLFIFLVYAVLMWVFLKKKVSNIKTVLFNKLFYVLSRLLLLAYTPIVFTAAWHMRGEYSQNKATIAAAVIVYIFFGILPIAFNAYVVWGKGKSLLLLYLKLRFGPFYSIFHYQKALFHVLILVKKLLIASFLGWLATPSGPDSKMIYAQVIILVALWVIYIVALIALRPYLDHVHLIIDIVVSAVNCVIFGVAIMHHKQSSTSAEVVTITFIGVQFIACLIGYIHSWTNIVGGDTYPTLFCSGNVGPENSQGAGSVTMSPAQQERADRQRKGDVSGALPQVKIQKNEESEEVDSSLQSSKDEMEDGDIEEIEENEDGSQ